MGAEDRSYSSGKRVEDEKAIRALDQLEQVLLQMIRKPDQLGIISRAVMKWTGNPGWLIISTA
jgi:hypothetical protein